MNGTGRSTVLRRAGVLALLAVCCAVWGGVVWRRRAAEEQARLRRVVLLTLDGPVLADVRDRTFFPKLHAALERHGVWFEAVTGAPSTLSLPGYQRLATGHDVPCATNECGRVTQQTVADALLSQRALRKEEVALFASWSRTALAFTAQPDAGVWVDGPDDGDSTPERPWRNARLDVETLARARAHWARWHPRLLQVSLLDTDEWAHRDDRPRYEAALHASDDAIAEVLSWVDALPAAERAHTLVLVTADHGRGKDDWREHFPGAEGPGAVFLIALNEQLTPRTARTIVEQRDVRWLIEAWLGLSSPRGDGAGRPLHLEAP